MRGPWHVLITMLSPGLRCSHLPNMKPAPIILKLLKFLSDLPPGYLALVSCGCVRMGTAPLSGPGKWVNRRAVLVMAVDWFFTAFGACRW